MERYILFLWIAVAISLHADKANCQAPDWHWARVIDPNGFALHTVLATNEGGCYVGSGLKVLRYNDFGDHLWTIDFSDEVPNTSTRSGTW